MADGSREEYCADQNKTGYLTFSAPNVEVVDLKFDTYIKNDNLLDLSMHNAQNKSVLSYKSAPESMVNDRAEDTNFQKPKNTPNFHAAEENDDRNKRCFDRYDSSESSDSGVAVLSPPESSGCSSSDLTELRSPWSPESSSNPESEGAGRMPPWVCEPVRRPAVPAPRRRAPRRITEYYNQKMKPHQTVKKEVANLNTDDTNKCINKTAATQDWEKYISYLSQTLSPRVLFDVGKQTAEAMKKTNGIVNAKEEVDNPSNNSNGMIDFRNYNDKVHSTVNGYVPNTKASANIEKRLNTTLANKETKKPKHDTIKISPDPSANGVLIQQKADTSTKSFTGIGNKVSLAKADSTRQNGNLSKTNKLESKMNSITSGSNYINLSPIAPKLAPAKQTPAKRTNRKSSACIANSKNLTWSKANNLKQAELQKQQIFNNISVDSSMKTIGSDINSSPKINNIPNGIRQVPMTMNGAINGLNVPVTNFQSSFNLQQNNVTASSSNIASFVAMPQNVMLTTLRIPQNGIAAQTVNQPNINTFSRSNLNVNSPTKLNGQFVFPYVQNINGAVVQIPNLMTKVPSFVLPQTQQLTTQRQDLQNQQTAQFLINGTLLKLANNMSNTFTNVNKPGVPTSQAMQSPANKPLPNVGMTVQPKQNYTVNISHPMLVQQPGFIVTSVPNINVKETWSYSNTNPSTLTPSATSNNQLGHQPPPVLTSFSSPMHHSSSIPIAPVKPPDNPIQGTDPPSSTVKESDLIDDKPSKCDIPWLSKNVNNNNVTLESNKITRPFADIGNYSDNKSNTSVKLEKEDNQQFKKMRLEKTVEELRRVEEVARREETLFSQITVLKDVTSSVHSAMIESNYSSSTTESSESGIGTDKSIDSPADSQASKECDEDSAISLSVSVCSGEAQDCQKSPILKEPKTIRFPPKIVVKTNDKRKRSTDTTGNALVCQWEDCKIDFDCDSTLLEHLQTAHVESQANKEHYVCQWERCKVKGKPSCSQLWLNRHVLSHGGNKPFKCIVDECGLRFSTQMLLERHVNNHFNEQSSSNAGNKKAADSTPKLIRRNGKKLRYRRQPWSARMFDFIDSGIMEGIVWRLSRATRWRLGGACPLREGPGRHTITLTAVVQAKRTNPATGDKEVLLTYYPPNVVDDEWVVESSVKRTKAVEICDLSPPRKVSLYSEFCESWRSPLASPPPPPPPPPPVAPRVLPPRQCASSRVLHTLLQKQKMEREVCPSTNTPLLLHPHKEEPAPSGAKKRKLGRPYGGNAFWPCGR